MDLLRFSQLFLGFSALIGLLGCQDKNQHRVSSEKPNVIFIMADDLGYADIEPYGQQKIYTPHLSQMAKEGILFTQFYAGTSVCAPSRASLITGRHTGNTKIRGNFQNGYRNGQMPLQDEQLTLAELMKAGGYRTGMIGKWGLGNPGTSGDPLKQGFDFYYGYTDQILAHNYFPEFLLRNGEKEYLDNSVVYQDNTLWHEGLGSTSSIRNTYSNELFTKEALNFITENSQQPFFLYVPLTLPHDNGEQEEDEVFEVPDQGEYQNRPWTKNQKDYAAMITRMDATVGAIREKLKELGIDQNTLIIFTSDNGPLRGHQTTAFFDSNGELRGGKRDLYEGGIRVPFLAVWPEKISPNTTSTHQGGFWDVMPTLAEVTGYRASLPTDGISFLPELLGEKNQKKHNHLYWEFHNPQVSLQAILQKNYKFVRHRTQNKDSARTELYDLSQDLGEHNDISKQFPELTHRLDSLAQASRTPSNIFMFPEEMISHEN